MQRDVYNCYIDESGCEGFDFTKNTLPWFILSSVIVKKADDKNVSHALDEFIDDFYINGRKQPKDGVHWVKLSSTPRQIYIQKISEKPFCQIVVAAWKSKHNRMTYINHSGIFYRYIFKILVEKISWFMEDNNGWAKIICSEGTSVDIAEMRKYIAKAMIDDKNNIKPFFNPNQITSSTMGKMKMLRIADACASAYGNALNPNEKGRFRHRFANTIKDKLFCRSGSRYRYGLKILPADLEINDLLKEYPFIKNWL